MLDGHSLEVPAEATELFEGEDGAAARHPELESASNPGPKGPGPFNPGLKSESPGASWTAMQPLKG